MLPRGSKILTDSQQTLMSSCILSCTVIHPFPFILFLFPSLLFSPPLSPNSKRNITRSAKDAVAVCIRKLLLKKCKHTYRLRGWWSSRPSAQTHRTWYLFSALCKNKAIFEMFHKIIALKGQARMSSKDTNPTFTLNSEMRMANIKTVI